MPDCSYLTGLLVFQLFWSLSTQAQQPSSGDSTKGVSSSVLQANTPSGEATGNLPSNSLLEGIIETFEYDPTGKRDPFQPFQTKKSSSSQVPQGPILPLQRYDLDELRVVGIIWDVPNPKSIVQTKDGKTYYVGLNDKLGKYNGYVAAIREGEIVVIEAAEVDQRLLYQSRILKLQKD